LHSTRRTATTLGGAARRLLLHFLQRLQLRTGLLSGLHQALRHLLLTGWRDSTRRHMLAEFLHRSRQVLADLRCRPDHGQDLRHQLKGIPQLLKAGRFVAAIG
jgi:hypothetical protein